MTAPTQPQPPQWGQPGYQPPAPPSKKRHPGRTILIVIGALVLFGIVTAIINGTAPTAPSGPAATEAKESGISKGAGSKDAAADVKLLSFRKVNADGLDIGEYRGTIEIVNHSEGTSDYYIELVILDSRGTNVDWTNAVAQHVRPGQRALANFSTFEPSTAKAQITQIQRTASS